MNKSATTWLGKDEAAKVDNKNLKKNHSSFKPGDKVPVSGATFDDWLPWAIGGGGALLAHSIASSLMESSNEDKRKESIWRKLLRATIPVGVGLAGGYGGWSLGNMMKSSQANGSGRQPGPYGMRDKDTGKEINLYDLANAGVDASGDGNFNLSADTWGNLGTGLYTTGGLTGASALLNLYDMRNWHPNTKPPEPASLYGKDVWDKYLGERQKAEKAVADWDAQQARYEQTQEAAETAKQVNNINKRQAKARTNANNKADLVNMSRYTGSKKGPPQVKPEVVPEKVPMPSVAPAPKGPRPTLPKTPSKYLLGRRAAAKGGLSLIQMLLGLYMSQKADSERKALQENENLMRENFPNAVEWYDKMTPEQRREFWRWRASEGK